jgi:glycosyltransferase involved in cell wall biosynthesis
MRLLFVVKTLDSRGGGAERVLTLVTSGLASRGHKLSLVSFGAADDPDFYPVDGRVGRIWLHSGDVQARSTTGEVWRRILLLRRTIKAMAPDVAIGFMHSAYVPLALAALTSGVPVVASEHILYNHYASFPLEALALRLTAPLCARMTVISDPIRRSFPPTLAGRMEIVPNPVLASGRFADPIGGRWKIILSVGRLSAQKDQRTLIEAFARVAKARPAWVLRILGEGPLRPMLENVIDELKLRGRVQLPGAVEDIDREYESAQMFVVSSRYESFGMATAEALAHGLPAVGFADCPGTNEIVHDDRNGILVHGPDRVAVLAAGLAQLMDSSALREKLGGHGPSSVERYSLDGVVDRWEDLLQSVRSRRADQELTPGRK